MIKPWLPSTVIMIIKLIMVILSSIKPAIDFLRHPGVISTVRSCHLRQDTL